MESEVLSLEQACEFLSVSAKTLIRILREDHIPARKIGREWRFSRQALIDWISAGDSTNYASGQEEEYIAYEDIEMPTDELIECIKEHLTSLGKKRDVKSILPSLEQAIPLPAKANLYTNYKQKRGIEKIQFEIYWNLRDELKLLCHQKTIDGLPEHEKPT